MDSMRSLNTSLPGASPSKPTEPPEQILAAFKAAALSVTKLYQTAAGSQGRARSEGYQDALDDLLAFLDKEDIGLSDGEGWRIRRWATERLDGRGDAVSQTVESEDETLDKTERGSSPEVHRAQSAPRPSTSSNAATRTASPAPRAESAAPTTTGTSQPNDLESGANPTGDFTFRSSHPYPQDAEMTTMDSSNDSTGREGSIMTYPHASRSRTHQRHNSHPSRQSSRTTAQARGTTQKRKFNMGEYFDFTGFGNGRDPFGGNGKRGRFA